MPALRMSSIPSVLPYPVSSAKDAGIKAPKSFSKQHRRNWLLGRVPMIVDVEPLLPALDSLGYDDYSGVMLVEKERRRPRHRRCIGKSNMVKEDAEKGMRRENVFDSPRAVAIYHVFNWTSPGASVTRIKYPWVGKPTQAALDHGKVGVPPTGALQVQNDDHWCLAHIDALSGEVVNTIDYVAYASVGGAARIWCIQMHPQAQGGSMSQPTSYYDLAGNGHRSTEFHGIG
ncbi:uncharacterized protein EI90DRAFT_3123144 [Cantharellus anzutake]|uniref:uncharacterized protein n=1 Tax=Cantharellus anzutake TaxID=1750568 RepID=UPI001905DB4D|nr:uncharacterized protein EI90DRAFT_3123144 [Cantharellus anzutake]KAF8332074.1 hypothetical protein EI90DRAFT_3123144 [Cantharellus anzutake]